ncbi:SprT-like domain-containing protein [Parvicella tangerina]|uniref:SprT domain-containing protein n=1 Tax=Parvicella tangerina TaxID=2829795 RepID=A0A916JNN0_9FLAO|nr:SprT-like domain-containing protein [Parvicella tangerina]CAG5084226.1 hypothetical protein CRYO30217_02410 [Parvicella tangerina]
MKEKESKNHLHPLYGYAPDYALHYIDDLVKFYNVHFKVVSPRKTKFGDCRYPLKSRGQIIITVNLDLPKIQFLITSLHELAHAKTFREYHNKVSAHGNEWKNNFSLILRELYETADIPFEEKQVLKSIALKPTASSYGSVSLQNLTKRKETIFLKDIANGNVFTFNDRSFRKIRLLRTYVLCSCESSARKYKIHRLAEINASSIIE